MSNVDYVLTTFSPAMFGDGATVHIRVLPTNEAKNLISEETEIVASRVSHELLARHEFPRAAPGVKRYATLKPGMSAIHLHYRGPAIPDTGEMPERGIITLYLIEVDEYHEPERD